MESELKESHQVLSLLICKANFGCSLCLEGREGKKGFPGGTSGKEPSCQCQRHKRHGLDPWVGKISWRREWQPLEYSHLKNSMDRGAWQATVHGVTKELDRTEQLSTTHYLHSSQSRKLIFASYRFWQIEISLILIALDLPPYKCCTCHKRDVHTFVRSWGLCSIIIP